MGTKVEYSINLLATFLDSKNIAEGGVDLWEHYQNKGLVYNNSYRTGINKLQGPLDRMLDRNNIESIKKTMQMHEDIFKHQVRELHRVYSVQKKLMNELKNEITQHKFHNPKNDIDVSHPNSIEQQHQPTQIPYRYDFHVQSLREDLSPRERGFDLERLAKEDIFTLMRGFEEGEAGPSCHTAFQSCKISKDGCEQDMEVDLTLSIGSSRVKNSNVSQLAGSDSSNGKTRDLNSSGSIKTDRVGECSDSTTPMRSSTVTFTQQRKGPHWLSFSSSNA